MGDRGCSGKDGTEGRAQGRGQEDARTEDEDGIRRGMTGRTLVTSSKNNPSKMIVLVSFCPFLVDLPYRRIFFLMDLSNSVRAFSYKFERVVFWI